MCWVGPYTRIWIHQSIHPRVYICCISNNGIHTWLSSSLVRSQCVSSLPRLTWSRMKRWHGPLCFLSTSLYVGLFYLLIDRYSHLIRSPLWKSSLNRMSFTSIKVHIDTYWWKWSVEKVVKHAYKGLSNHRDPSMYMYAWWNVAILSNIEIHCLKLTSIHNQKVPYLPHELVKWNDSIAYNVFMHVNICCNHSVWCQKMQFWKV